MRYRLRLWCTFRCCVYCTGDARFCVSTWLVAHFGCAVCLWSWWGKCVYCQCVMMFYVADGSLWDARFCVSTFGWKRGCGVEGMMLWRRTLSLSCPYAVFIVPIWRFARSSCYPFLKWDVFLYAMPKRLRSSDICGFCLTYIYVWCFEFNISFSLLQLSAPRQCLSGKPVLRHLCGEKRVGRVRKRLFRVAETVFWGCVRGFVAVW